MENQNLETGQIDPTSAKEEQHHFGRIWIIIGAGISFIIIAGLIFYSQFYKKAPKKVVDVKSAVSSFGTLKNIRKEFSFPAFNYQKSDYKPSIPEYQIKTEDLSNFKDFEKNPNVKFTEDQKMTLEKNNFFITLNKDNFYTQDPDTSVSRNDDWTELYDQIGGPWAPWQRYPENSVFVSSDYLLHVYHRFLEKEFEYIEQKEFYPRLQKITNTMLNASISSYKNASTRDEKESYQRLIAYFAIPSAILESASENYINGDYNDNQNDSKENILANLEKIKSKMPAESYEIAQQELNYILAAEAKALSPLFGKYQAQVDLVMEEDYTQFGPRSHYAKNPILRDYFRSMMWYGRTNFLIKSPELTRDAFNITKLIKDNNLGKEWEDIYVPTAFLVGASDDPGIIEYQKLLDQNNNKINSNFLSSVQPQLKEIAKPKIMSTLATGDKVMEMSKEELQSETAGFRFMGQRFTPDAFVFSTLTQGDEKPDPETGESLPSTPTALMVTSLLGNQTSDTLLSDWIDKNAPDSKNIIAKRMDQLRNYFSNFTTDDWTQNIYWSWLYTIKSLYDESGDKTGFPMFMKNSDWNLKNLQCSLGSWTELKHDTLLYAKQSYAEMGGGGDDKDPLPVPKGYVEANVEFFDRIIPLVKMTQEGLNSRELLKGASFESDSKQFIDSLEFFRKIAIAELNNKKISDEDFEKLRLMPGDLSRILDPLPGQLKTEDLARSALIADVHTDGKKMQIMYEANGIPNYIYVAIKDQNGTRMTKGLVYSNYEFSAPLEKRLTDKDWREWVYTDQSKVPEMSDWSKSLIK